ncbi:MotE family protein [Pseudooceanicola aestuarii]|uniref:MotE family protein n=1 Tax=Pseudooceanicola aestuarii TaxID=2697319 RepID=UPI0013D315C2|nr:hypothetical protein [Pseudooceanicola aestuarii]
MRPAGFIFGALLIAVSAKIGLSLGGATGGGLPSLASSAEAAGPTAAPIPEPAVQAEPAQCEATPEEMLTTIREERDLLSTRRDTLDQRAAELELAQETLKLEQDRLGELQMALEGLLDKVESAHTRDVDRLVALYQNMKPKDAAVIMNDLDIEVTVMVLGTMDERAAAPIMAALDPIRARAISQIILERSKLPGDQRLEDIRL